MTVKKIIKKICDRVLRPGSPVVVTHITADTDLTIDLTVLPGDDDYLIDSRTRGYHIGYKGHWTPPHKTLAQAVFECVRLMAMRSYITDIYVIESDGSYALVDQELKDSIIADLLEEAEEH